MLHDIAVGDTDYTFTSEPAVSVVPVIVVPVTGTDTVKTVAHKHVTLVKTRFVTDALGANQAQGRQLVFKVTDNGKVVYRNQMGAGQKASAKLSFLKGTGKHKVQVLKNGVVATTVVVKTGK